MKRFQRVLAYLPREDSEQRVLTWCQTIAASSSPELIDIMKVIEDFLPEYPPRDGQSDDLANEKKRLETLARESLPGVATKLSVEPGSPVKEILNRLASGTYDLVVLPIDNPATRAIAEKLARKSPVGVLCLPPDCEPDIEHLLLAVDFSDLSELALNWAEAFTTLASEPPDLEALHVVKMPESSRATLAVDMDTLRRGICKTARKNLDDFLRANAKDHERWRKSIAENPMAGSQIVSEGDTRRTGLIVLGSHGRNALSVALLGSQTAEVIRTSRRPVLIVKKKNTSLDFLRQLLGFSSASTD